MYVAWTFDPTSVAGACRLARPGAASEALRVPQLAGSLHASSPRSVTLTQLRFTSLAVVNSQEDWHLQDRAHAGRTNKQAVRLSADGLSDLPDHGSD